jgi:hypothetical protein
MRKICSAGKTGRAEKDFLMTPRIVLIASVLTVAMVCSSSAQAFFPPDIFVKTTGTPPDPFKPPTAGGLGEPTPPQPTGGPTVQTPEPATMITALTGLALAAGYRLTKRRSAKVVE